MEEDSGSGQLILGGSGQVVLASGVAADPVLQQMLVERWQAARRQPYGAFMLSMPRPLVVLHRSSAQATFFFVHPDPALSPPAYGSSHPRAGELADACREPSGLEDIVGSSEAIQQLKSDIQKIAPLEVGVLIVGESGTGKELAALAIHELSQRRGSRMIFVNAAALPSSLVESELFGYEPGAFTGAGRTGRKGKFELADRSSLFFDEIGDMPPEIQVKLLRVLQDGVFERVGGHKPQHSDFRLICASNRNFQQMIGNDQFRLDLYYRISGVTLRMPSLRERLEDIPELVTSFLAAFARRHRSTVKSVDPRVHGFLSEQSWPGNVRQLLHAVERAAIFCDGPKITIADFRHLEAPAASGSASGSAFIPAPPTAQRPEPVVPAAPSPSARGVRAASDELAMAMIREALARHGGNKKKVAEELGISRTYLYKRLNSE